MLSKIFDENNKNSVINNRLFKIVPKKSIFIIFVIIKVSRKTEIPPVVIAVGNKIKSIIDAKRFRQRDVAHDAGLDVENLRKYINGSQEMKNWHNAQNCERSRG